MYFTKKENVLRLHGEGAIILDLENENHDFINYVAGLKVGFDDPLEATNLEIYTKPTTFEQKFHITKRVLKRIWDL